jgi:hypothetical protein
MTHVCHRSDCWFRAEDVSAKVEGDLKSVYDATIALMIIAFIGMCVCPMPIVAIVERDTSSMYILPNFPVSLVYLAIGTLFGGFISLGAKVQVMMKFGPIKMIVAGLGVCRHQAAPVHDNYLTHCSTRLLLELLC